MKFTLTGLASVTKTSYAKDVSKTKTDVSKYKLDKFLSGFLIFLVTPIMIINCLNALLLKRSIITSIYKTDALGHFVKISVFTSGFMKTSATLIDILKGNLSFCGVPLTHKFSPDVQEKINKQYSCNAGICSVFDLHQHTGLAVNDAEKLLLAQFKLGTFAVLFLLLKSLLCFCFYGQSKKLLMQSKKISIFGLNLDNSSMEEAVHWVTTGGGNSTSLSVSRGFSTHYNDIEHSPQKSSGKSVKKTTNIGFFINVNSINISFKNTDFHYTLQQANMLLADGSGMRLAAKSAGYLLKDNTNGTDMLPHLCKSCVEQSKSLYFLGAKPGVAAKAASSLEKEYPGLVIAGTQHGFIKPNEYDEQIKKINDSGCDILLVAMGSPFQEEWLLKYREKLHCQTALAVGGLFDFYSGDISRAPLWLRELGFEWIWRLLQEPVTKFKRYILGTPLFLFRIYALGLANKRVN